MTLRVATALTDAVIESAAVQAVNAAPGGAAVVRRCRDVVELRAVALTSQIDVAVVDGELRGFDRDVVAALAATGVRCIAVASHGGESLLAMGVAHVVDRTLSGIDAALRGDQRAGELDGAADAAAARALLGSVHEARTGRVVAVWGPTGAPGRTTVAIELAAAVSGFSHDVLLIDADTVGPSIAQHLGLIDDTSGLAAGVRTAARGRLDAVTLAGLAVSVPSGPRVLVGLPSPDRWTELRPASVDALLQCARGTVPWTVVDIGFGVEGSDLDWVDPGAPVRYGAARATLATADVVVCVGRADPIGLTRLIRGLRRIRELAPTAHTLVVVNRIESRSQARQIGELLADEAGVTGALTLPVDDKAVGAALARASSVAELSPRSSFAAGVRDLAAEVLTFGGSYDQSGDPATRTHRRLLRSPHRRHRHSDASVV